MKVPFHNAIFQRVKGYHHATSLRAKILPGKFQSIVEFVELIVDKDSQSLKNLGGRVGMAL